MSVTVNDKNLGHATAYAYAKAGGYTGTPQQYAALLASQATIAEDAESYAKGTRSGTDVASTDPAYHNNAKYYAEQAAASLANIPSDYTTLSEDVNEIKSDLSDIDDAFGVDLKPKYTLSFNVTTPSVTSYNECTLTKDHRYTIVINENNPGALDSAGCLSNNAWSGRAWFRYRSPSVITFTVSGTGVLATTVLKVPAVGSMSIFDTTDNDALKAYLDGNFAIAGASDNVYPAESMKRIIDVRSGKYINPKIYFIGDSQTQKQYFTNAFKTLFGVSNKANMVNVCGWGGAGAREIASYQGGIAMYAKPLTIPATTTAVEVDLYDEAEGNHAFVKQSTTAMTEVHLGGVAGSFSYNSSQDKNYFTRASSGDAVVIDRPIQVKSKLCYVKHTTQIYEVGTNDYTNRTAESLSSMLKDVIHSMIRHNDSDQYIVLGLTATSNNFSVDDVNRELARTFGVHFIDIKSYLINYGLEDEEITPTAQDETDIANGVVPSSLREDAVHFNQYGGNVIGKLVYDRGVELGYWL